MLLQVEELRAEFAPRRAKATCVVRGVSFEVERGETFGIVGESGCGKSVTALSLVGLLDMPGRVVGGRVLFDGEDIARYSESRLRRLRGGRIAFIFQDPTTALNPVLTIGLQITETIRAHTRISRADAHAKALEWLGRVRIPDPAQRMGQYPHELSGGMRQRVMIAMAFCLDPQLLIADEPTTALDVTVQKQILDLLDEMRVRSGTATILITHDLGIVAERCSRAAVMYAGKIVETGPVDALFSSPKHPYTKSLLRAIPDFSDSAATDAPFAFLPGRPPEMTAVALRGGCAFAPRCSSAMAICRLADPPESVGPSGWSVQCHLYTDGGAARSAPEPN